MVDEDADRLAWLARWTRWLSLVFLFTAIAVAAYFAWRLTRDHAEELRRPGRPVHVRLDRRRPQLRPALRDVAGDAGALHATCLPEGREDEGWAAFGLLTEDPADLPPEMRAPPPGRHLAANLDGDRPHLPQLRRLPRRQRPHQRRRAAADRGRDALEHRRPLRLPGLPRRRRRRRALQPRPVPDHDRRDGPRARPGQPLRAQVRRHRHGPRAPADHRRPLRRFRPRRANLRPRPLRHLQPGEGAAQLGLRGAARARAHRRRRLPLGLPAGTRRRGCSCTGTATTPRSPSATAPPPSAPAPRPRSSTATRSPAWRPGSPPPSRRASPTSSPDSSTPPSPPRAPPIYARECAACHGATGRDFTGAYVGKVTPIAEIATDRGRLDNYTHDLAVAPERALRRLRRRALPDLPQDRRLRQRPARRSLAARPLPAQRLGPDARGAALAPRRAPARLPPRLRRLRPARDGLRHPTLPASIPRSMRASSATRRPPPRRTTARPARRR